jgi:hypothetical protein
MSGSPSPFVEPEAQGASTSSSDEGPPQSGQKPPKVDTDNESLSDSEWVKNTKWPDTTDLPDLVGSDSDEEDPPSTMAKDLAREVVAEDSDDSDADEETSAASRRKSCGKGRHSRTKKGWAEVRMWKLDTIQIPDIIPQLKVLAQEIYDLSGTGIPKSK